jgi:hypothetical protein
MGAEPGVRANPTAIHVAKAFAALFVSALVFGLFYSAVISFFLAKRRSEEV